MTGDRGGPERAACDLGIIGLGIIGLGVMGRSLAANFADHGYKIAVFNRTAGKTREFAAGPEGVPGIYPAYSLPELVELLRPPKNLLIMVPAGPPVDEVIAALAPRLAPGDLIIDGGDSHFADTQRRSEALAPQHLFYLGMGVSGGELGARYGASFMPGGSREGYERVAPLLHAAAARVNGDACVSFLGPGAAGHCVKMVHNGIESALEHLLAEGFDLLLRGLGLNFPQMAEIFASFNQGPMKSYLVEITALILKRRDEDSGEPLVPLIKDEVGLSGPGRWSSKAALDLEVPVPTIDMAVARLWRGGCIIRAALLEEVAAAYQARPDLPNLLLDPTLGGQVMARQGDWREVMKAAVDWGLPAPALMASPAYVDAYRSRRLPANLIRASRDCCGAHTYERVDRSGDFHTDWLAG